jgi:hypothetical protein
MRTGTVRLAILAGTVSLLHTHPWPLFTANPCGYVNTGTPSQEDIQALQMTGLSTGYFLDEHGIGRFTANGGEQAYRIGRCGYWWLSPFGRKDDKPMRMLLYVSLALAVAPITVSAGRADAVVGLEHCPPSHPNSASRVQNLLGSPLLPQMRTRYDLGTASASDIRLLTDEHDRETCRALWTAVHAAETSLSAGDRISFYRSGDTFFVPISRSRRPSARGTVQLDGYSSLDVYDSGYRLIGRFGA